MVTEEVKQLIDKLKKKTAANQAIWSKTSRDNEFKLELQKGAITTDNWEDQREGTCIDFAIINERGDTIEHISFNASDKENYAMLIELHDIAKRSYYKVDETIKTIFTELDSNKIIGKAREKPNDFELPF